MVGDKAAYKQEMEPTNLNTSKNDKSTSTNRDDDVVTESQGKNGSPRVRRLRIYRYCMYLAINLLWF